MGRKIIAIKNEGVNMTESRDVVKKKIQTLGFLAALAGLLIAGLSSYSAFISNANGDYQNQIELLNKTEINLHQLADFVDDQKNRVVETQKIVESLKKEEAILRPTVESQRQLVDAILQAQQIRNRKDIWIDRIIGFLLGIIASTIGGILLMLINKGKDSKTLKVQRPL